MTKGLVKLCSILLLGLLSGCSNSDVEKPVIEKAVNLAPTAIIKLDKTSMTLTESVAISGELSTDPDGDPLSYEWRIQTEAGDDYPLENNTGAFVFQPSISGTYQVTLTVTDGLLGSNSVSSTITVEPSEDSFPTAIASGSTTSKVGVVTGFTAEYSSAGTDQSITYQWALTSKPASSNTVIDEPTNVRAFLIPDVAGHYEVSLTITNTENQLSATDVITLTIDDLATNSPPQAVISPSRMNYGVNETVRLDATNSQDSDGLLSYQWSLEQQPPSSHSTLSGDGTQFIELTPDVEGEYHVKLVVSDEFLSTETIKIITVTNQNIIPVANAGPDQVAALNTMIELDASASSDAEGDNLQYVWRLVSKPSLSEYDALAVPKLVIHDQFIFVPDVIGDYVLSLEVFDGIDYSAADPVHILVTENQRPVAKITSSNNLLDGSESYDPENQSLTFSWKLLSAPEGYEAGIISAGSYYPIATLSSPVSGNYIVQLIVSDGIQESAPEAIHVVIAGEEEWDKLIVSGRVVDEAAIPLANVKMGGITNEMVYSDDNGMFELLLKSRESGIQVSKLPVMFESANVILGYFTLPENSVDQVDVGDVTLPVNQRKDVSLIACENYTGPESLLIDFYLAVDDYDNMQFLKPVRTNLTLDEAPVEIALPASGNITMRLSPEIAASVSVDNGSSFFTHQYQADDTQADPLVITVCN